ncbi:hypothetical protein [Pseudooceanicola nanhaiensis]|uniref:hypothetical protein n=1 Tax=Pseudooceanicola nanhaiensis TaxID=375761 RepID=UPI0035179E23
MIATVFAFLVVLLTCELWIPLAFLFGAIELVTTFSIGAAWDAFASVPVWIWDFVLGALS